jgi:homospermidine synthase
MSEFKKRVLFVGFGAVARCTLPILLKHVKIPPGNVTIMDFEPNEAALRPWVEQGMTFVKDRITPENLGQSLGRYLSAGDLLIDGADGHEHLRCQLGAELQHRRHDRPPR